MKHLFIINPTAGKSNDIQALQDEINGLDLDTEILITSGSGDAERLTRDAVGRGIPMRIYACGGDGTLNEVVNAAAGADHVAITNVPRGSGNDFLKIFGAGWQEGFSNLRILSQGPQAPFDLIDCNGKLGIGVACVGVDARVAADVHRYKALPLVTGPLAYVLALVVNVILKLTQPAVVDMGEIHHDGRMILTCACNGRYYGGGFMPVGDAQPDDGVLDFLLVPKRSRLTFARLVGVYAKGGYRRLPEHVKHWHGDQMTITSSEEMVGVIDGETIRSHSFTIKLAQQKVNFFWPAHLDYHAAAIRLD